MHPYRVVPHPSNRRRLSTYKPSSLDPTTLVRRSAAPLYIWPTPSTTAQSSTAQPRTAIDTPPRRAALATHVLLEEPTRQSASPITASRNGCHRVSSPPPNHAHTTRLAQGRSRTLEPQESVRLVEEERPGRRSASPPRLLRRTSTVAPVRRVTLKRTPLVILPEVSEQGLEPNTPPSQTGRATSSRQSTSRPPIDQTPPSQAPDDESDDSSEEGMEEDDQRMEDIAMEDLRMEDGSNEGGTNGAGSSRPPSGPRSALKGKATVQAKPKPSESPLQWKTRHRTFKTNPGTTKEKRYNFDVFRTLGSHAIPEAPHRAGSEPDVGDIHLHVHMGGVQYWVWTGDDDGWVEAEIGFRHPIIGKTRVLSHKPPQDRKYPTWVLNSTLSTYRSRDRDSD